MPLSTYAASGVPLNGESITRTRRAPAARHISTRVATTTGLVVAAYS
jgi:hypothetical protein